MPECIEKGLDYHGNDLKQVRTPSAEVCACRCKDYDDCRFFTWHSHDKTCYLKSSDQGRMLSKEYSYSGSKDCCTGECQNPKAARVKSGEALIHSFFSCKASLTCRNMTDRRVDN